MIVLLASISSTLVQAGLVQVGEKACSSSRQAYKEGLKATLKCLEKSQSCKDELSRAIQKVVEINDCLPAAPKGQGTGGGYELKRSVESRAGRENESKKFEKIPLYECIAKWKFAAERQYKGTLPKDDCSSLVEPFLVARDAFYLCMSTKNPGANPVMKVEL